MSEEMHLCLSDLLDQDLSSYEFFYALPKAIQDRLQSQDPGTFDELQEQAARLRRELGEFHEKKRGASL